MENRVYNVLFICTGNSARSILAEATLNALAKGRFKAYSAGSQPRGEVNPGALKILSNAHLSIEDLRSKSWDEFGQPGAPEMDFVFTVCDQAAGETCPFWPGQPMTAHWGVPDPAVDGLSPEESERRFHDTFVVLKRRIELFLALPLAKLDRLALSRDLQEIGKA